MRVLLVTAHPDDECMFFAPTIRNILKQNGSVELLCLSTGDGAGQGRIRVEELHKSCRVLGISKVNILDSFKDGMNELWEENEIRKLVKKHSQGINLIYTFDNYGVSGHPNHCAISRALRSFPQVRQLKSFNILLKYSGPIGALILSLYYGESFHISVSEAIGSGRAAMYQHRSQMVWFRHLFVIFSIYMYINIYKK